MEGFLSTGPAPFSFFRHALVGRIFRQSFSPLALTVKGWENSNVWEEDNQFKY